VVAADFNGDDWPDIYVANDGMANFLWMNQKDDLRDDGLISAPRSTPPAWPRRAWGWMPVIWTATAI